VRSGRKVDGWLEWFCLFCEDCYYSVKDGIRIIWRWSLGINYTGQKMRVVAGSGSSNSGGGIGEMLSKGLDLDLVAIDGLYI
jgi:hypothetical protein